MRWPLAFREAAVDRCPDITRPRVPGSRTIRSSSTRSAEPARNVKPQPAPARDSTDAVRALEQELIACHSLALLGNMAAMIAHEYNNIMTPMLGRAELALASGDSQRMRDELIRIVAVLQRCIGLSGHLLGLVRPSDSAAGPVSVLSAVREAIAASARPFERDGIELAVDVPGELHVRARCELLVQVVLNLLINARNAMKGARGLIRVSARADGEYVAIAVCDSGVGMTPQQIVEIINPFLRADPQREPTDWQSVGLGLNVCRMIARQHGATIEASANADRGCTFRLRWPAG